MPARPAAAISSGVRPTICTSSGPTSYCDSTSCSRSMLPHGIAHDADPAAAQIGDAADAALLAGDEEGEGAAGDQRGVGLGRQGDVGPDDGELGLALIDLAGAFLRALGQDEPEADLRFLAVESLHEAGGHARILRAERPDRQPQGARLAHQIETGRRDAEAPASTPASNVKPRRPMPNRPIPGAGFSSGLPPEWLRRRSCRKCGGGRDRAREPE